MILSALNDYYHRLVDDPASGVAPPGYSPQNISFVIVLADDGDVVDVKDIRVTRGKKHLPRSCIVPQAPKRAYGIKPNFLWDKTSYVLGITDQTDRSERTRLEHESFKALHIEQLARIEDQGLGALLAFLRAWDPTHFAEHQQFIRHGRDMLGANVVFQLDGDRQYLHDRPAARAIWQGMQAPQGPEPRTPCLVTGQFSRVARLHPSIKGVDGAQSSGASLVSFNLDASTSYGKDQGDNAPVSEEAAFAYTTALNHLLRRSGHNRQRLRIGDATVVFWAYAPERSEAIAAEDLMGMMLDPGETDGQATQRLHDALKQVQQMRPLRDLDAHLREDTRIFVLGLAPNASRLCVRFWETDTLGTFARRLATHYQDLALEPSAWQRPPSPHRLALATAPLRDRGAAKESDIPPLLAGELARSILTGGRYPRSLLSNIVMRFRADGQITPLRVALCKAVLTRNARLDKEQGRSTFEEEPPVSLDLNDTNPGYLLGRLFSTLENVQRAALGKNLNATIRDRYYGAASATPASIFPVLLRNAQNHLSKLRKEKTGLAVNLEKEIGEILCVLPSAFPRSLSIEDQGRFAIGYYHQNQARFGGKDSEEVSETEPEGEAA